MAEVACQNHKAAQLELADRRTTSAPKRPAQKPKKPTAAAAAQPSKNSKKNAAATDAPAAKTAGE